MGIVQNEAKLYKCDPFKNISCTKESCFINNGPCSMTHDINCSVDGGKEYNEEDIWKEWKDNE